MAEPETHLPSRPSSQCGNETAGRPPVLEDSSGSVGRQFPFQSLSTTGEEASAAGKSAGSTPYPNVAILFESGDDEDDNIKCGQCNNPIAYCHCSPTMLPPRINVNQEEDNEETSISLAETSNKENRPVEVHVGRGMGEEGDNGGGVQAHRRRMYAPGTPQRMTCRSLSPTPDGFVRNHGQNYVPLRIPVTSGQGVATAKWVKVRMGVNPTAWGCMYKGGVIYQGDVHAAPIRDRGTTPDYTNEQLLRLRSDYRLCHKVDEALEQLGDKSLVAEVARYRGTMDGMQRIQNVKFSCENTVMLNVSVKVPCEVTRLIQ
jgi:hypothetical protein